MVETGTSILCVLLIIHIISSVVSKSCLFESGEGGSFVINWTLPCGWPILKRPDAHSLGGPAELIL